MPRNNAYTKPSARSGRTGPSGMPTMRSQRANDIMPFRLQPADRYFGRDTHMPLAAYRSYPTASGLNGPSRYFPVRPGASGRRRSGRVRGGRAGMGFGGTAKSGFKTFRMGYSKFQALYGGIAFSTSIFFAIMKFNNLGGAIDQVEEECRHADVVLAQLTAVLEDPEAVRASKSDSASRKLLAKLQRARDSIAGIVGDLRGRVGKYDRGNLGIVDKARYLASDSSKVSGLRSRLRQDLDNLQDLVIWLNRLKRVRQSSSQSDSD